MKAIDFKIYVRLLIRKRNINRVTLSINLKMSVDLNMIVLTKQAKFINFKKILLDLYVISSNGIRDQIIIPLLYNRVKTIYLPHFWIEILTIIYFY